MDIGAIIQPDQAYRHELTNPNDGKGIGVFIDVLAAECEASQEAARKYIDTLPLENQTQRTHRQQEPEALHRVAGCVSGWDWNGNTLADYRLDHSFNNVFAVVRDFVWIRNQIAEVAGNRSNFTGKGQAKSATTSK